MNHRRAHRDRSLAYPDRARWGRRVPAARRGAPVVRSRERQPDHRCASEQRGLKSAGLLRFPTPAGDCTAGGFGYAQVLLLRYLRRAGSAMHDESPLVRHKPGNGSRFCTFVRIVQDLTNPCVMIRVVAKRLRKRGNPARPRNSPPGRKRSAFPRITRCLSKLAPRTNGMWSNA